MQESKNLSTKTSNPPKAQPKIIFSPLLLYLLLSVIALIILIILLIFLFKKIFKQSTKKRVHLDGTVSKSDFKVDDVPISNVLKPSNIEKVTQPPLTDKSSNMIKLVEQKSTKNETTNQASTINNNHEFEISNTFNSETYSEKTENNNENVKNNSVIIVDE